MASKLSMCNSALYLVGADEIESFDDGSREARICSSIYQTTKDSLLASYPWTFSLAMVDLAKTTLATTDPEYDFGFLYRYQLPVDCLRVIRKNDPSNDYVINQDKLYTNDDAVQLRYQYSVSEAALPAYFQRALEFELCRLLSAALLQDETQLQIWTGIAKEELARARAVDAQNAPSPEIDPRNFVLTSVR